MYCSNIVEQMKKINKNIKIDIITGEIDTSSSIKKFFSTSLIKQMKMFIEKNKKCADKIDFIVEYPFFEWNIFTLLYLWYMKKYFKKSKIYLSLHEYQRVNFLRKKATDFLIKISDYYIFTDRGISEKIKSQNILFRSIPSNIARNKNLKITKILGTYCYFGLIGKNKAFHEMIEAWKLFNIDNKNILNIYTSTKLEKKDNFDKYNIKIYFNLENEELSKELEKNEFMILPIRPFIGDNNGTLKAAAVHENIPIGIFSKELEYLGINIKNTNYEINSILVALEKSKKIEEKEKLRFLDVLNKYSNNYSFEKNAKDLLIFLEEKNDKKIR